MASTTSAVWGNFLTGKGKRRKLGEKVTVHGLAGAKYLNGLTAEVFVDDRTNQFMRDDGRYSLRIFEDEHYKGKKFWCQPKNIKDLVVDDAVAKRWWASGAYTLVFKLVALTVLFPWDNSCCERGFSCMNRIKCRMRASLGPVLLDQLMRISMCGPPLDSWDPRPAIAKWMAKKDRRVK